MSQAPGTGNGIVASNVNILKAYRLVTLNKVDMKSFSDNVFLAYQVIEKDHGNSSIKGFDFLKLAKMLCVDYPNDVVNGILLLLDKREEENVEFDEFLCGVRTILLYDSYFEEMEHLFRHLDFDRQGKVSADDLKEAVRKLRGEEVAELHDLRIPAEEDVEAAYQQMVLESDGMLNYEEF